MIDDLQKERPAYLRVITLSHRKEVDFQVIRKRDWFCDKCTVNASSHCIHLYRQLFRATRGQQQVLNSKNADFRGISSILGLQSRFEQSDVLRVQKIAMVLPGRPCLRGDHSQVVLQCPWLL